MQHDDIWEVKLTSDLDENTSGDVSKKQLFKAGAKGGLCNNLYTQAKNMTKNEYKKTINRIVEKYIDAPRNLKKELKKYFIEKQL